MSRTGEHGVGAVFKAASVIGALAGRGGKKLNIFDGITLRMFGI